MSKPETLSIDLIRIDGGSQARIKSSEETIEAYAELIDSSKGEWPFGPLDVFHDGSDYFLADGFHRTLAALRLNRASLPCRIHKGTAKDARIFGMTANDKHGLRMTRADKRACVEWLLDNGTKMTQVEIAEKAGVSHRTVKTVVAERKPAKGQIAPLPSETQGKSSETSDKTASSDSQATEYSPNDWPDGPPDDVPFDAPEAPVKPEASIMLDSLGKPIPTQLRPASELAIQLQSTGRELDKYRKAAKDFAEQPGGEWISVQDIDTGVRTLKNHFQSAQFHCVCPRCNGKGCERCDNTGWLPEHRKNIL